MASLVFAIGAVIYISATKIHERKEKKRTLKAQTASEHDLVGTTVHLTDEQLPVYHKELLPPYNMEDQHPALRTDERKVRNDGAHVWKNARGESGMRME